MDVLEREYVSSPSEDKLYSRLVMSTSIRSAILQRNQDLRNNSTALRDLSFGRQALSIPTLDYHYLVKKYPELHSANPRAVRDKAWARFLASSESAPYKVR